MINLAKLTETPTLLIDARCSLGEGPRWHRQERRLYWVDIDRKLLLRWDAASGAVEQRQFDAPVACFAFRRDGGLVLGMKDGCALIDGWDAPVVPFGPQVLAGKPRHRMNDGRTDPAGRFWVGSLNGAKDVEDATLYRLDANGTLTAIESGMTTCNGAAFFAGLSRSQANAADFTGLSRSQANAADFTGLSRSQANAAENINWRFCHSDTPSHAVRAYDVDPASGALSNRRILHQFERGVGPGLGRPDGGSFDAEGCYWVAMFDGWRVVRLSPKGEVLRIVELPVQRPTMIAFGGDDGRTAFVTSATTGLDEAALAAQPGAGGVFAFRVEAPGMDENAFGG
ncbi:SMP-30/gluconolactonase/LRE family protein [Sphingomonas lacunae]|uniref:SMP-30/gluconolactonase/LRE family protein n=1 Tax=Sphingomonas lacunae TaxID=2698828 RepID=A0A6M4ATP2_9SPHN|nr:SMP-30/gluconolactonase/LRE family protein [Sphingomonas lacunae]QJQ31692.1 SMP-30/gluconolactonase/LRE family protein [Sphingomonas lacunae]